MKIDINNGIIEMFRIWIHPFVNKYPQPFNPYWITERRHIKAGFWLVGYSVGISICY